MAARPVNNSAPEGQPMNEELPVNPIPPVIVILCLIATAVELWFSAAEAGFIGDARALGWRLAALQDYAFSPVVLDLVVNRGDFSLDLLRRFVTYPFIHPSFTAALFGIALLLALGKFVGDALGNLRTLAIFFVTAIFGAFIFGALASGAQPLYGLFPPIYGLIGAYTYLLWVSFGAMGQNQIAAFRLIGFLLGLQLMFGLIFGSDMTWIADLAAFAIGFSTSPILVPGGWSALVAKLRQRR